MRELADDVFLTVFLTEGAITGAEAGAEEDTIIPWRLIDGEEGVPGLGTTPGLPLLIDL